MMCGSENVDNAAPRVRRVAVAFVLSVCLTGVIAVLGVTTGGVNHERQFTNKGSEANMDDENELSEYAAMAEKAERYDDMAKYLKALVKKNGKLTEEQRNMLSEAFKHLVGTKRSSWRIISEIESTSAENYRSEIGTEMKLLCNEVIELVSDLLLKAEEDFEDNHESKVDYLKMQGDYTRYMAEITTGQDRDAMAKQAGDKYGLGMAVAAEHLGATNPKRLGIGLNYGVFLFEVMNDPSEACATTKKAFDDAMAGMDAGENENGKESTLTMQLLRNNLDAWTSEPDE